MDGVSHSPMLVTGIATRRQIPSAGIGSFVAVSAPTWTTTGTPASPGDGSC